MEQVLKPNLVPYKRVNNLPIFMSILFFIPMLTIRVHTYPVAPGLNLAIAEMIFPFAFILLILDKWDLNKVFNHSFSNLYFIFLFYGTWNLFMSLKIYHNSLGFALSVYRDIYIYPLGFFLGYHYFVDVKHFKNFHRIIQIVLLCYLPLSVIFFKFNVGSGGSYLQYFDHYEGWVCSFLIYYAASKYFIEKKVSKVQMLLAFVAAMIIIMTNRRGIWISTFFAGFVVYYMAVARVSFVYLSKIFLAIGFVIGIFYLIAKVAPDNFIVQSVVSRVEQTISNFEDPTEFGGNSIAWRLLVYQESIRLFQEHPILGRGMGYLPTVVFPKGENLYNEREGVAFHDLIMSLLVTMGIIGMLLYVSFHLRFIFTTLRDKNKIDADKRPYVASMFGLYIGSVVWSVASNDLWSNAGLIIIIWTIMGAITRQFVLAKAKRNEAS
jgi:hypothetical protein